jgi:hypothetical protein
MLLISISFSKILNPVGKNISLIKIQSTKMLEIETTTASEQHKFDARSLGIRLRVQAKEIFKLVYIVRLWCGGHTSTTPRRTDFYFLDVLY